MVYSRKADGINKIATADGSALLQITDVKNVRAVSVDERHGVLWAYIQNTLWAYRFNGKPAFGVPLISHGDNGNGKDTALGRLAENFEDRLSQSGNLPLNERPWPIMGFSAETSGLNSSAIYLRLYASRSRTGSHTYNLAGVLDLTGLVALALGGMITKARPIRSGMDRRPIYGYAVPRNAARPNPSRTEFRSVRNCNQSGQGCADCQPSKKTR
jgi:hypothetical protein